MGYINNKRTTDISRDNNFNTRRFKTIICFLQLGGIPVHVVSISNANILYNTLCVVCFYCAFMCALMDTFVHRYDLKEAMKKSRICFGISFVAWTHFSLSYHKHNIEQLLNLTDAFTWEELPTRDPDTGHLTKAGYIPIIQRLTKYFVWFLTFFHIIQSAVRIVFGDGMILTAWFAFDTSASPVYVFANITQAVASWFGICTFFSFPGLYATLVCVACSQLEKLRLALLDIRQTHVTSAAESQEEADQENSQKDTHISEKLFQHIQKQLNECICHHQEIKRYMELLEDTMNFPLCGLFLIFLSALCLNALSIITSLGDYADMAQALIWYIYLTASLCIYCWLGNELSNEAEAVSDAAWSCHWVGTPVSFQRSLMFIIAGANKEFTLTAGKFVPVCNKTMMNMMNQSVSFFMFLLHVKDKNTEKAQPM